MSGWTFDLTPFGIRDSRAVATIGDQFFVSDGYDSRPRGILSGTPSTSSTLEGESQTSTSIRPGATDGGQIHLRCRQVGAACSSALSLRLVPVPRSHRLSPLSGRFSATDWGYRLTRMTSAAIRILLCFACLWRAVRQRCRRGPARSRRIAELHGRRGDRYCRRRCRERRRNRERCDRKRHRRDHL